MPARASATNVHVHRAGAHLGGLAPWSLASGGGVLSLLPSSELALAVSGFAGLFMLYAVLRRLEASPLHAAAGGWLFGASANAVALHSLVPLLIDFGRLSQLTALLVAVVAFAAQGAPYALTGLLHGVARRRGVPSPLAFVLALLVGLGVTPQLFPWRPAATQLGFLPLVQGAELGGEALIDTLMATLVALVSAAALARRRKRLFLAAGALTLLAGSVEAGTWRMRQVESMRARAPGHRLGVVQSNVGIDQKHYQARAPAILAKLRALTLKTEQLGADLTVWGETAYPYPLARTATRAPEDSRRVLGADVRGPILLGLETYGGSTDSQRFNSAWLVRADGALGERVDKARLLPFGEYVPLWRWSSSLQRRFRSPGFSAGRPDVIRSGPALLGVLICYEDLFAEAARETVARGARVLVNLTNDAWFGPGREPELHERAARLRAVELRRDLVRAVNTGVSSFTSATGASLVRTGTFVEAAFVARVRLLDERTLYARLGDWVTPLAGATLLALCCAHHALTRRRDASPLRRWTRRWWRGRRRETP